jgi:hypothetical protein
LDVDLLGWRVDPNYRRFLRWLGGFVDEALRVCPKGVVESIPACRMNRVSLSIVHPVRRHQANAKMMVVAIIPLEKITTEALGILDSAKSFRKLRLILQGLEVAFREWIVV